MTLIDTATDRNEIEYRAAETLEVVYPTRLITVRAMPYERPTNRVVHRGRQITEVVSRGAFDGVEHRHKVGVYRDHDKNRGVGRTNKPLDVRDDAGLMAELYIIRTPLGDETLELAAEGLLAPSVGFAPMRGGERWSPDRNERRLDKCYLDHIAMVGDPAYDEAEVLDVRSAAEPEAVSATPNLDAIRALLTETGIQLRH